MEQSSQGCMSQDVSTAPQAASSPFPARSLWQQAEGILWALALLTVTLTLCPALSLSGPSCRSVQKDLLVLLIRSPFPEHVQLSRVPTFLSLMALGSASIQMSWSAALGGPCHSDEWPQLHFPAGQDTPGYELPRPLPPPHCGLLSPQLGLFLWNGVLKTE